MHPLRDREQAVVFTMTANQLKAYRQAMLPGRERQVDARQTEQGPATAEQRVAGDVGALRRFAGGTGREQTVEAVEQRIDTTLRSAHLLETMQPRSLVREAARQLSKQNQRSTAEAAVR